MDPNVNRDLLTRLGCLADGRFNCPPDMREVTVIVSPYGDGVSLMMSAKAASSREWSYTDDFIIHQDSKGHASYYAWSGVCAVFTNPL